jgi:hypothetical protein
MKLYTKYTKKFLDKQSDYIKKEKIWNRLMNLDTRILEEDSF